MKRNNQTNTLLVELLIVILFFMLGSAILMQVFGKAGSLSRRAGVTAEALAKAQNLAEELYASGDPKTLLEENSFEKSETVSPEEANGGNPENQENEGIEEKEEKEENREQTWILPGNTYDLLVRLSQEEVPHGSLRKAEIEAVYEGKTIFTLPVSKYVSG